MKKIAQFIKFYLKQPNSKIKITAIFGILLIALGLILIPSSLAAQTPISSVTIQSETLSYSTEEEGSWQITKSAKWISKGKARITLKLDTIVKPRKEFTDVILVLDTSGSMQGEIKDEEDQNNTIVKLQQLQTDVNNLINDLVPKGNNIALVTFNDTSEIITGFTNNTELLKNSINSITATGNTNYYQALVNVDNILKKYQFQDNRDCVVLFLTDGLPNVDSPNEIPQYQYLKNTYPNLTINSIQYEMGDEPIEALKQISDNQYIAYTKTLNEFLYNAAVSPVSYDNFKIVDYIESNYFTIKDKSAISVNGGTISLENNKVSWNLDGTTSGLELEMTIDVNLKDELIDAGGIYPTNEKIEISSTINNSTENITSELTPILSDNYQIIYEENAPNGCTVTNMPQPTKKSVFDTVTIISEKPSCEGYQFKEWQIITQDVEKINADHFIMPEKDVTLRAVWSKLTSNKSMDGKVSVVQNLYQMMADNSVPDNIKSTYVSSSSGINFSAISSDTNGKGIYQAVKLEGANTPIYYYRGDVNNNNLIFANYCWKIVRTTSTKGIKLVYNGVPNADGSCTATGTASQIGTSLFNYDSESLFAPTSDVSNRSIAYSGYMYGDVYRQSQKRTDIVGLGGKSESNKSNANKTNYIYASSIAYDSTTGKYTLINGENRVWNDTYAVNTGNQYLYTCLSETENTCSVVYFVTESTNPNYIYYSSFSNGTSAEEILNKELVYGNDVVYDATTGLYTLKTTIKSKIKDLETDKMTIGGTNGYRYTCFNETGTCQTINYIHFINPTTVRSHGNFHYVNFSDGIKVEDAVKQMTTESLHTTSSNIKTTIDNWYATNMNAYTNKLEDTTWCNDRTISDYGAWNKDKNINNGGYYLTYKTKADYNSNKLSLSCQNKNDAYTVNDTENGNGDLTYPVALLTADEIAYAGGKGINNAYYLYTGQNWWSMSPYHYGRGSSYNFNLSGGKLNYSPVNSELGVRPSVSLAPGTRSIDGDGTPEDPFIVK